MTTITEQPQHDWAVTNPVPGDDEIAVDSDTGRCKKGDGVTSWQHLTYTDDRSVADEFSVIDGGRR